MGAALAVLPAFGAFGAFGEAGTALLDAFGDGIGAAVGEVVALRF